MYKPAMNNRDRRKANRMMYQLIAKSRKEKTYNTVAGLNLSTREVARLTKLSRQSSRQCRWAAIEKRSEQDYYSQDFYE